MLCYARCSKMKEGSTRRNKRGSPDPEFAELREEPGFVELRGDPGSCRADGGCWTATDVLISIRLHGSRVVTDIRRVVENDR